MPPSSSKVPGATGAKGSNVAVCRQLQQDATRLQRGGQATSPAAIAQRLHQLTAAWTKTVAQAKDPKLRASVQKAVSAINDLASSASGGKKISIAQLQARLKSAGAGLQKACGSATTA